MSALAATILGAGFGLGLLILASALRPRKTALADLVRAVSTTGQLSASDLAGSLGQSQRELSDRSSGASPLRRLGLTGADDLDDKLRVLGKDRRAHDFEKLAAMVVGFSLPLVLAAVGLLSGFDPPLLTILLVAVALGCGGFLYPDIPLAEQVEERRRAFRHALGAYLELVSVLLAGGAGTQTALEAAARSGDGWVFDEIRRALDRASATNRGSWELFAELADELGIDDLRDLASSLALAGGHGARVRDSLVAKADAMRHSMVADLETVAETRTEKMIVPVAIMTIGLTAFVGYGAMTAIAGGGAGSTVPVVEVGP